MSARAFCTSLECRRDIVPAEQDGAEDLPGTRAIGIELDAAPRQLQGAVECGGIVGAFAEAIDEFPVVQ